MTHAGFTLNGTKDPVIRKIKLMERKGHLESQIDELKDKLYLIECEIALLNTND